MLLVCDCIKYSSLSLIVSYRLIDDECFSLGVQFLKGVSGSFAFGGRMPVIRGIDGRVV